MDALHSGFLDKRGEKGLVKAWRTRWFWLTPEALHYAEAADTPSLGSVDMHRVLRVVCVGEQKGAWLFNVEVPGRVYELAAASDVAMRTWIEKLQTAAGAVMSITRAEPGAADAPAAAPGAAAAVAPLARGSGSRTSLFRIQRSRGGTGPPASTSDSGSTSPRGAEADESPPVSPRGGGASGASPRPNAARPPLSPRAADSTLTRSAPALPPDAAAASSPPPSTVSGGPPSATVSPRANAPRAPLSPRVPDASMLRRSSPALPSVEVPSPTAPADPSPPHSPVPNRPVPPSPSSSHRSISPLHAPTAKVPPTKGGVSPRVTSPRNANAPASAVAAGASAARRPTVRSRPLPPPPPRNAAPKPKDNADMTLRDMICAEIVSTESVYLLQLNDLINEYQVPLKEAGVLSADEERVLFCNLPVLVKVHTELLESLQHKSAGEALLSFSPFLSVYVSFVNSFDRGSELLRRLADKKPFAKALARCKNSSGTSASGLFALETLRVVPIQRVPRYVLLLKGSLDAHSFCIRAQLSRRTPQLHACDARGL